MEQNSFKKGIVDGLPICIGYFSVAFAFGIFAVASGLTILQATLISLVNLTSAGQFAAVPIFCAGSLFELAVSQLVINSRYALMSVSLSQKLAPSVSGLRRFLVAFGNTDEIFAVSMSNKSMVGHKYMYGLILTPVLGWTSGTLFGALAGDVLPAVVTTSLGLAIYAMFVAIVFPQAREDRAAAICVIVSIILSCAFKYIPVLSVVPSGFVIIICAVLASLTMAIVAPIKIETEEADSDAVR